MDVAKFEALSQHMWRETTGNHDKPYSGYLVSSALIEAMTASNYMLFFLFDSM
jgi:hypothetical protein